MQRYRFIAVLSLFLLSTILLPPITTASDSNIIVTGYNGSRVGIYTLAAQNGSAPPGFFFPIMSRIYFGLRSEDNFGPSGKVLCTMSSFNNLTNYVSEGSLVNDNGELLADVFWGPPLQTELSEEEADELAKFVTNGGVLSISTTGYESEPGTEYNLLFEKLDIDDSFKTESLTPLILQSDMPNRSIVTSGPFGEIGPMAISSFRKFENSYLSKIASVEGTGLVYEGKIGKGYLSVTSFPLFVNPLIQNDNDNLKYYLNLFALGCRDDWRDNAKVLNVPSFKQGLKEYDDLKPLWENTAYDNAGSEDPLRLTCDTNGDGATMAECGCAVTSASMVAKYHGIDLAPDRSEINPETLNFFLKQDFAGAGSKGYYSGNIIWTSIPNFTAKAYEDLKEYFGNEWENYEQPKLDFEAKENFDPEKIKQYIDTDRPVILKVNGVWGQHWVVVKGYDQDTGRLIINDPARPDPIIGKYTYLDEHYEPVMNSSMVVYEKTYSDFRYLQLVTTAPDSLTITDENGNALSNLETSFDAFYGDATSEEGSTVSSEGVYFYTIKQPDDGNFKVTASAPFAIYSSDAEGKLTKLEVDPLGEEKEYLVPYIEETAGEQISIEEIVEERPQAIDIRPWTDYNWISRSGLLPVPVAILSTNSFDAMTINESSIRFGVSGTEKSLVFCLHTGIDVNDDNKLDKLCFFNQHKLKAKKDTTQMTLTADNFSASDIVTVIKHIGILDLF